MPNTSNITNMPDLKKLFVYVNFTNVDGQEGLTALKGQLKTSSQTKYPERVFYVANDGSIITHGQEFGISDALREQINNLATDSVNFKSSIKNLTGVDVPVGEAAEITATSVIGKYVNNEILKNKTIVAAKENSGITVEESKDNAGTTTYTVGTDLKQIVDAKSIIAKDGKLSSNVELKLVHEAGEHGEQSPFLVLQTKAVTGNSDQNQNYPSEVISKFDVSEFINDGMIKSVDYNESTGDLVFTWNADSTADDSTKTTTINLAQLFNIEGIHSDNTNYITVGVEIPGDHSDADKKKAYHITPVVDNTNLKDFSSVTYTPANVDTKTDAIYSTNYANDDALSNALGNVSGLADANKVADKIAQIDKDIVKVGNDAIAREKTITEGIDTKIADLQRQLNEEATARGNMDANLYGEAIPEAGPVNTIKKNTDAIAILNGADTVDGSVAQKIKALKEELDAEVEYKDANSLVKVAISQVDGVVADKENAVTVKTATLTTGVDQDAEYTLASPSDSGYTKAGGYKAKSIEQIAAADPSLVTNQDAWIYGQCIKTQAINAINSDDNEYIKIVREDNKTKIKFEPWAEVHTITDLADVDKI